MNSAPPKLTVGRQVLVALGISVLLLVVVSAIAVRALDSVASAKDEVIDEDVQTVLAAHRLDLGAAEHGVAVRNLLITGDPQYQNEVDDAEALFRRTMSELTVLIDRPQIRRILDDIAASKAELDATVADVAGRRLSGELAPEQLAPILRDELAPARAVLTELIDAFVEQEEEEIQAAIRDSDATASDTSRIVTALAVAGVVLALAVGGALTRSIGRRLTGIAVTIDAAASQILAGTAQQAASASEQAAAVQETVATADELAQTAEQSAKWARSVADAASRSADVARNGAVAVNESADAMVRIRDEVDVIAATVVSLAERAQDISGIVRAVEDLSEQIHLLALNAAIEAARAGDHGKGFSVVATEIRALADQSKRATNEISGILGDIQQGTNTAVMATEEGGKSVTSGVEQVEQAGATIEELAATVADSTLAAEQISASSGQQAVATSQISQAMRDMDDTAQQNAAAARQAEQAARDLNEVATGLKALVGAR